MEPIDMRQGSEKYSDNRQGYFLNSTCYIAINKRQRHATLAFLKIDRRHGDTPSRAPLLGATDYKPEKLLSRHLFLHLALSTTHHLLSQDHVISRCWSIRKTARHVITGTMCCRLDTWRCVCLDAILKYRYTYNKSGSCTKSKQRIVVSQSEQIYNFIH